MYYKEPKNVNIGVFSEEYFEKNLIDQIHAAQLLSMINLNSNFN